MIWPKQASLGSRQNILPTAPRDSLWEDEERERERFEPESEHESDYESKYPDLNIQNYTPNRVKQNTNYRIMELLFT